MQKKIFFKLLILAYCTVCIHARAALRRTPKVYNALITTDDNLTSSRAYPVIQPTIHETGIPHYPFGPYNAYGYYSPSVVRFGQPIAPGLVPREQLPYPLPNTQLNTQFPPQLMRQPPPTVPQEQQPTYETYPAAQNPTAPPQQLLEEVQQPVTETLNIEPEPEPETAPTTQPQQPVIPPTEYQEQTQGPKYMPVEESKPEEMPNDKLPIALNEYGLPPSLIPLQQYPLTRDSNSHIPPYVFNQYPLLPGYYDPITGFRDQYLPPYEYAASPQTYAIANAMAAQRRQAAQLAQTTSLAKPNELPAIANNLKSFDKPNLDTKSVAADLKPSFSTDELTANFENIKNVSKLKNNEVPDVPPPPIPSGAKTKPNST